MHSCRVAIARHMISVDKWNSRNVEELPLPRVILDYLLFKEYKQMGLLFIEVLSLIQNYLKENLTRIEICKAFEDLLRQTGSPASSRPWQTPSGSSSPSRSPSQSTSSPSSMSDDE